MWSAGQFTKATILFCFSYCAEQSMNGKDDSFMVGYIYISDLERKKSPQDRNLFLQQRELSPKQQSQVSSWGAKLSMLTSLCFCILILVFLLTALASHGPILSWFTVTSPGHWRWRAVCNGAERCICCWEGEQIKCWASVGRSNTTEEGYVLQQPSSSQEILCWLFPRSIQPSIYMKLSET